MIRLTIVNIIIYEKNYALIYYYFDYVMICMIMIYSRRCSLYKVDEAFMLKHNINNI